MKTKVKRFSKRSLAIFLGVLMLVTSIGLGSLTVANAYTFGDTLYFISGNGNAKSSQTTNGGELVYISSSSTYVKEVTTTNTDIYFHFSTTTSNNNNIFTNSDSGSINDGSGSYAKSTSGNAISTFNTQSNNGHHSMQVRSSAKFYIVFYKWSIVATTTKPDGYDAAASGGGSSGGSTDIAEAPAAVVSGTNIMFYICSYADDSHKDADLTNGSINGKPTYGSDRGWTWMKKGDACVQIAKTDRTTYYYITNNAAGWVGNAHNSIKTANGGETYWANSDTNSTAATTGATTLSNSTVKVSGGSLTLSTTCNKKTSSYSSKQLYIQYYLDGEWTEDDGSFEVSAANTAQTYSLPSAKINALTPGTTHTIKTVLTDGTVYYIADTDTFTVANRLTTPTITIDGSSSSSVTASTTEKSTITVTNVNSYGDGTVFKLYKGSTHIDTNNSGEFKIARNSSTAANNYKVIAIPAASDNSHSDSAYSSTVTLTVSKIAAPTTPTITVDKAVVGTNGKVTITVTNFESYDLSLYDLKLYRIRNTTSNTNATISDTLVKTLTSSTYVDTANTSTSYTYAHYMVKAVAKNSTVYNDSSNSTTVHVNTQAPKWYIMGTVVGDSTWATSYQSSPLDKFYSSNVFYRVVTVSSTGDYYFRLHNKTTVYGPSSTTTDENMNSHTTSASAFTLTSGGATKALKVSGSTTYVIFVDQSGTAPKVWVRTNMAQITVKKYYQTYSTSTDSYTTYDGSSSDTYLTLNTDNPFIVDKSTTFSIAANVEKDGYEYLGWYSSYATNLDPYLMTTSNNLTVTGGVTDNKTYYAIARQKTPTKSDVIVDDENKNVTITATWNGISVSNGRSLKNVPAGATVTISGSSELGSKFSGITVKDASKNTVSTTGTTTGQTISGVTFTMPSSNVTIYATSEEYWGSTDTLTLWYSASLGNPGAYTGSTWSKINVQVYADGGHHYAKIPASYISTTTHYFALSDDSSKVSDGKMSWTGDDTDTNAAVTDDSKFYLTADEQTYEDTGHYWYRFSKAALKNNTITSSEIDYVLLDVTSTNSGKTGVYTYSVVLKNNGSTTSFIARDGATTGNSGATGSDIKYKTFGAIGSTKVTSTANTTAIGTQTTYTTFSGGATNKYYTGTLTKGTTYKISTTVTDKRYYVKAFNVNGVTVSLLDKPATEPASSATYTCNYTVPSDAPGLLEIIPIYYHYDDSNCVTFYLEGFDETIQNDLGWGNSPYVYPFYATQTNDSSGGASNAHNALGTYPGQPMICKDGIYEIEVPTINIDLCTSSGSGTETGTNIKGITISNGWNDMTHRTLMGWSDDDTLHKQTYDYDDFHKIFVEKNPTNIYYQMKLKENRDNSATYRHTSKTSLSSSEIGDIGSNGNGWELLQDKFHRTTDILGNPISGAALEADPLYVISTGYIANLAGDYGTEWRVYSKDGTSYSLVTGGGKNSIAPSLLFMKNASSFNNSVYPTNTHSFSVDDLSVASPNSKPSDYLTLYNKLSTNYSNRPVYVSYEKNDRTTKSNYGGSGETMYGPYRLDGRWYYTSAGDLIKSKIEVEYIDGAGGYKAEENYESGFSGEENKGSHTGAMAYFTDGAFYAKRISDEVVLDKTKTFSMTAQAADGYEFVGWYIKQGTSYVSMNPTNKTSTTATTQRSSSATYVARYKKLTKGNLVVSNSAATGTVDSVTYNGTGQGLLTVQYTRNGGTSWTSIGSAATADNVTVGTDILSDANLALGSNFQLKVTLGNTPDGEDTFGRYKNGYTNRTSTTANQSYTINLIDLFTVTTEDETTVYDQNVFSLPFYTYFTQHQYNYSIVYTYTSTRLNATQTFTKTGSFTSAQVSEYVTGSGDGRRLTDAFITEIKPKESNFRTNMTFSVTSKAAPSTANNITTFSAAAAYTNDGQDTAVKVTYDLPYRVTDRVADGGYNLSAVVTDSAHKVSGEDGYSSENNTYYYDDTIPTFRVNYADGYNKYITSAATVTTDSGASLLTAPATLKYDGEDSVRVFNYWLVTDTASGHEIVKVYNAKFNYRLFSSYTLKPVYVAENEFDDPTNDSNKSASINYLGTTRNQWNNGGNGGYTITNGASNGGNNASDILFNDFSIAFNYKDEHLSEVSGATCGVIIEKLQEVEEDSNHNVITDMATYAAKATDQTSKITTYITSGFVNKGGLTLNNYALDTSQLNSKNRCEFFYNTFNSYGTTPRTVKNNVYRAYSFIKVGSEVILSAPVYYTMYGEAV